MIKNKKIRNIISAIKSKNPTAEEIRHFTTELVELMAESGVPPKVRREFYQYSQEPAANMDRLIGMAEDTLNLIEK